jgi:two-component system sensor histidine kinase MprB
LSLRTRLAVGTALALALAICAGLAAAYFVVRGQLIGEIDTSLKERSSSFINFRTSVPPPPSRDIRLMPAKLGGAAGYVQFVNRDGKITLPGGETTRLPVDGAAEVAAGKRRPFFSEATVAGTHVRIYTARLDAKTAAQIARPLTEVDHALSRIRLLFLLVSFVAVAAAAGLGLGVARTALQPVRRLTHDAERIANTGNLRERTDERRSDELGRLAHAFNTMLDALTRSVTAQRQLVADASHELRTPVAAARANIDLVQLHETLSSEERRRLLEEAGTELEELTQLVDELVELARGDAELPAKEPVRLDHLVEEAVETAARRTQISLRTKLEPSTVEAAPSTLSRAISNLIDNALKWSPPDKPVEVTVHGGAVTVRDHGPGIDAADLPHIFDRFYRAATARTLPGSGLGLAIVRQVAEAHGGTVYAEPAVGGGTSFTLALPTLHAG